MRELLIEEKTVRLSSENPNANRAETEYRGDILDDRGRCVSLELCPNRALEMRPLSELGARFCSVTWHSPGLERADDARRIPAVALAARLRRHGNGALLHLAGRNLSRRQATRVLTAARDAGVRNVFALQGDSSQILESDDNKCDFPYAADLVYFIKATFGDYFIIGVAGYPERHPKSRNLDEDIQYLRRKVTCGADFIITQASYSYQAFERFANLCRANEITIPIIPGIFIISSHRSLMAMSNFCGVPINEEVLNVVRANKENRVSVREFGLHHAKNLIQKCLYRRDLFSGVHIFTLNDLDLTRDLMRRLGMFDTYIERPLKIEGETLETERRCISLS